MYGLSWIGPCPVPTRNNGGYYNYQDVEWYRCSLCSSKVEQGDRSAHEAFHNTFVLRSEMVSVSNVMWCDPGNHPFKAGVPGSQRFAGTTVDDTGANVTVQMDACPEHAFRPDRKAIDKAADENSPAWGSSVEA